MGHFELRLRTTQDERTWEGECVGAALPVVSSREAAYGARARPRSTSQALWSKMTGTLTNKALGLMVFTCPVPACRVSTFVSRTALAKCPACDEAGARLNALMGKPKVS